MTPCEWLRMADGTKVHVCYGKGRGGKKKLCKFCAKNPITKECDFPVDSTGRTCDAGMCDQCARVLGRGEVRIAEGLYRLNDSIDVCPIHRGQAVVIEGKILAHDF